PGTVLEANYRILTDGSRDFSNGKPAEISHLTRAIDDALDTLDELTPNSSESDGVTPGIGHNNPPDAPLSKSDYDNVRDTLRELRDGTPSAELFHNADEGLAPYARKIAAWASDSLKKFNDGFFSGLGSKAAAVFIGSAAWVAFGGKLQTV